MCDPVSATIAAATAVTAQQQNKSRKSAEGAARESQRIAQEAENQRISEAQAEAERLRLSEERRQGNIAAGQNEISSVFGQFNDDFYNNRSQSYLDYATPQLDKQYQDQMRSLTASLARSGNLNSSLRGEMMGKLQQEYDTGRLTIADQARGFSDQARSATDAARARLMETNMSLADPGVIRTSAQADASRLSANPQFASLGSLLSNLSGTLGNSSGARQAANTAGSGVGLYNSGPGGSSGRLVN